MCKALQVLEFMRVDQKIKQNIFAKGVIKQTWLEEILIWITSKMEKYIAMYFLLF